jgi:uncharacterized Zn finger protein
MAKHAPMPLCKSCGEDRPSMVEVTIDGGRARRMVWHCNVCGSSWTEEPSKTDISGNHMLDGE